MVIGIEGLVGCGKTSICRGLLNKIPNSIVLHGGNLYRAVVYDFMKRNKDIGELQDTDIFSIMNDLKVKIELENNETVVYINNKKVNEEDLQSKETSTAVSIVGNMADNNNLFLFARKLINSFREKYNVIVSGRDLMKIYPDLDYHFLIIASLDERVKRKAIQYNQKVDLEELKKHIIKRDELQEKAGFYYEYPNTIKIDVTKCTTIEESVSKVYKYITKK